MAVFWFFEQHEPLSYATSTRLCGELPLPYPITREPEGYLEFARADLAEGNARGLINSFSNTKRALHLAVDSLLHHYGLLTHLRRSSFPNKLWMLDQVGLIPTTIIQNLNVERNLLEHEYTIPTAERATEALDVAQLLTLAIERLTDSVPHEAVVGWRATGKHLLLRIEPYEGEILLFSLRGKRPPTKFNGVRVFGNPIRDFNGLLYKDITVGKKPIKRLPLQKKTISEWKALMTILVTMQRGDLRRTFISGDKDETMQLSTRISWPLDDLISSSWADFVEQRLQDRHEKQRANTPPTKDPKSKARPQAK